MGKKLLFLLLILLVFSGAIFIGFFWLKSNFLAVSSEENYQNFLIQKGETAQEVANDLASKSLIKSALAFKFYTQFTGISKRLFAGEYRISPNMNLAQIVKTLTSGPLELWVTIPEGLRREEIADKFIEGLSKKDPTAFRKEFLDASADLEGNLFPDTYLFPKEANASTIVARMKATFDTKLAPYQDQIKNSKHSLKQIVILASILERETKTDQERPIVAGILFNRLSLGMPLQADATVQYALASSKCKAQSSKCEWWPRPLTLDDLGIDSKYNTYKYSGLPPAGISNPGISSLKAAINPTDNDYLYYIHDPNEQIHYAKTLDEHNANVRKYLSK